MVVLLIDRDEDCVTSGEEGVLSSKVKTTKTDVQIRKNFTIHQVNSSCGTP